MKRTALFFLIFLAGCSSTKVVGTWKDPAFSPTQVKKALVLGVGLGKTNQRLLEDALVDHLKKRGIQATASYAASQETHWDRAKLKRYVVENGYDTVIVSRLVDVQTVEKDVPPQVVVTGATPYGPYGQGGYYGYYSSSYHVIEQEGYTVREDFAVVETRLYDAKADKLVWSADSRTEIPKKGDRVALINEFAEKVCSQLGEIK